MERLFRFLRHLVECIGIAVGSFDTFTGVVALLTLVILPSVAAAVSHILTLAWISVFGICVLILWASFTKAERLAVEIKDLKEQKLPLEIEAVPCSGESRQCNCLVRIKNPSKSSTATGVKVNLISIVPAPIHPCRNEEPIPVQYPIKLFPRHETGETINPKTSADFLLFFYFSKWFFNLS
jgi:hypothetical protein